MKICFPYNGDVDLVEYAVKNYDFIHEVYGDDGIYISGRTVNDVKQSEYERQMKLAKLIRICHDNGVLFNYTMNYVTAERYLSNTAYLNAHFNRLKAIGVDWITVTVPFIAEMAASFGFKVAASSLMRLSATFAVGYVRELGVSRLVFDTTGSRNIGFISDIHSTYPDLDMEIMIFNHCRIGCQHSAFHFTRHNESWLESYCQKPTTLRNFLQSNWIRAKDISRYEANGVTCFKMCDRNSTSEVLKAKLEMIRDGELPNAFEKFRYAFSLKATSNEFDPFFDHIFAGKCNGLCSEGQFCDRFAKELI